MKYILFWKECEASLVTERTFFSKVNFPCREMNRSIPNGQVNRSNCLPAWKPAAPNSDSPPHLHMCWRLVTTLRIVPASPEFQFKPSGVALWFGLLAIARCDYPLVVAPFPTAKCNFFFSLTSAPLQSHPGWPVHFCFSGCSSLCSLPVRGNHRLQAAFFCLDFCLLKPCQELKTFIISSLHYLF